MEDEYRQAFEDAAFCDLDAGWCSEDDDSDVPPAGIRVHAESEDIPWLTSMTA